MQAIQSIEEENIHMLWDRLAELPVSQPADALDLMLSRIGDLIDSTHAYWFCMYRLRESDSDDIMLGWRIGPYHAFNPLPLDEALYRATVKDIDMNQPGECLLANIRRAGQFRGTLINERVPPGYFESDYYNATHTARGVRDSLAVVAPLNEDTEIYVCFLRKKEQTDFTHDDLSLACYALRSLGWFHRRILLSYGLSLAENPLTPTERQVIQHLLTDMPEKQIAEALEQKTDTTHKHIKSIYRKFNVNSRAGLMSLWLGHSPA